MGHETTHEVSDYGRVRTLGAYHKARILAGYTRPDGYVNVRLGGKVRYVHRLVLEAFHGAAPTGTEARHLNGTRDDNRAGNLAWGTAAENQADRKPHGTYMHGEMLPQAKLTWHAVRFIRAQRRPYNRAALAHQFGVSEATIKSVRARRTWRGAQP